MKTLARSLTTLLSLSLLLACASAPKPAGRSGSSETTLPTPTAVLQPTKQSFLPAAVLPPTTIMDSGYLSPALNMNTQRAAHTATLLPDGAVLIAGGFREEGTSEISIASAEIYDPKTSTFAQTGEMNEARSGHTATLLPNGLVLIAGGWGEDGRTSTTELYDPQTGKFRYAASMAAPRASMTATLLKNGQLLVAGGDSARNTPQLIAEIYDPVTDTFTQRGAMNRIRYKHAAVLLQNGNVLVIGGSDQRDWNGKYTSAEMYDANTGTFTQIADMNSERFKLADAAVLLNNGDVLIGGGNRQIEIFDVQTQRFIEGENIDDDYYFSVLTLLRDGRVLITGGYDSSIQPSEKAWIYSYDEHSSVVGPTTA